MFRVAVVVACGATHVVSAAPAAAQSRGGATVSAADLGRARELFEQGVRLVAQERWGEALEFFQRSRAIVERPSTVFNIGSTLIRLGRVNDAVPPLEQFLLISDPAANAAERTEAQRLLDQARGASSRLTLTLNTPDARVEVDGVARPGSGRERVIPLDPGRHTVRIRAEGFDDASFDESVLPAQAASRTIELRERPTLLRLDVSPATAGVRVDGTLLRSGEHAVAVSPGVHELDASAPGHRALHRRVTLRRGQVLQLQLALAREGGVLGSPWFWLVAGVVVVSATSVGICVGVQACIPQEPPYGGTTGTVLQGLRRVGP